MKPEKIKNKCVLEIMELFENDTGTKKALDKIIAGFEVDDNSMARAIYTTASKKRPTNTKLKNVGIKYKDMLIDDGSVKPEAKKEVKPEVKKEVKNEANINVGEPFKKGTFHLNRLGEVCELLEDYEIKRQSSSSNYSDFKIKMFNWTTMQYLESDIINIYNFKFNKESELYNFLFDMPCTINEYYIEDSAEEKKQSIKDYNSLLQNNGLSKLSDRYDLLLVCVPIEYQPDLKKGILPDIKAIDNSTTLKNIRAKIDALNAKQKELAKFAEEMNIPNLKCNFSDIISEIKTDFNTKNNCDTDGYVTIKGQKYKPSIYSKDTLIQFCKDRNLLLTTDAIMSLSCLGESEFYNQLKLNDYIIFAPDSVSQNLILIKLCAELEKYSTVKDTLNLLKEDKVLYRIVKKDSGGNFYYVYKCENEAPKGKNENVETSSQPM